MFKLCLLSIMVVLSQAAFATPPNSSDNAPAMGQTGLMDNAKTEKTNIDELKRVTIAFSTLSQQYAECTAVFSMFLTVVDKGKQHENEQKNLMQRGVDSLYAAREIGSIVRIPKQDVDSNVSQLVSAYSKEVKDHPENLRQYDEKAKTCYQMTDDATGYIRDFLIQAKVPEEFIAGYR